MSKKVVFSPLANRDLESIWSYLAEECENPRAASKVIDLILSHVELLADFPESGTPLSSISPISTPYRFVIAGSYLAFYRVGDSVFVDRVLSSRSDYLKALLETGSN